MMSILPQALVAAATRALTSSLRPMLQGCAMTVRPCFASSARVASQASALRLEITTLAPALPSSSAIDLPMPRVEPVTTATWPVRSNSEGTAMAGLLWARGPKSSPFDSQFDSWLTAASRRGPEAGSRYANSACLLHPLFQYVKHNMTKLTEGGGCQTIAMRNKFRCLQFRSASSNRALPGIPA